MQTRYNCHEYGTTRRRHGLLVMTETERKRRVALLEAAWHAEHRRQRDAYGEPRDHRPFLRIADAQQKLRLAAVVPG